MELNSKVALIERAISDKKGTEIETLYVTDKTTLCDCFVIASGNSTTQVRAIADNVEEQLAKAGEEKLRDEGHAAGTWVALDYGDVIVHVFQKQVRETYRIEELWR